MTLKTHVPVAIAVTLTVVGVASAGPPPPDPPAGCAPPTAGRVALWRGEDTAQDSVGSHDGTLEAGAGFRAGRVGRALSLPGGSDRMTVPGSSDLDLLGDLTVDTWIEVDDENFGSADAHGVGGDRQIILKPGPGFLFWIEGDSTTAAAAPLRFAAGNYGEPGGVVDSEPLSWAKDTWYHVAVTRSGDTISFYRDGSPVGSATISQAAISDPAADVTLGAYPEAGQIYAPLKGGLDETGLWNRALTPGEVKAIVDTATGACATPSPTPTPTPTPTPPPPVEAPPARDTTAPETEITGGTPNGQEIKPGTPQPSYTFASDDPGARFECRAFDTVSSASFSALRAWAPCASPYTSELDTSRPSAYAFEVRAIDAAGNADDTPARRGLIRHADPAVPAVDRQPDRCKMVTVGRVQGSARKLLPGCRLARIRRGRVPCMNVATRKMGRCRFSNRSGAWVHSRSRRGPKFALIGEAVSPTGKRRGNWIVAAHRGATGRGATTVECAKPAAPEATTSDTAGRVQSGQELSALCLVEDAQQEYNAIGPNGWKQLYNWVDREVCMRNSPNAHPHPDFAQPTRLLSDGGACYTGFSASLNDMNGTERDASGNYYQGEEYCHMIVSGGYEVPAAKRPATRSSPYPGSVMTGSYLAWRPVNTSLNIANEKAPSGDPNQDEPARPADY
jgi:hypothetical protein